MTCIVHLQGQRRRIRKFPSNIESNAQMSTEIKQIKTAMLGLGTVNKTLLGILMDKQDRLRHEYGLEFIIVAVADSSGIAVDEQGFSYEMIKQHKEAGKSAADLNGFIQGADNADMTDLTNLDLVLEASPVDLETGGVGLEVCRKALAKGIAVVLANKGPLVLAFEELTKLAASHKTNLKYSATVCGGLPVLNIGQRDLIAGDIHKLQGVFNGTTNFILDSLANGKPFDAALKEAQDIGAAEADPSLDIGGWDTANKLLIIANTIMDAGISLKDISVKGIEDIDANYLATEEKRGNIVKLVAKAENGLYSVAPMAVPKDDFLAQCTGWEMAVEIHTDIYGITYHKLWEKEPIPTAASMLRDALHIFTV